MKANTRRNIEFFLGVVVLVMVTTAFVKGRVSPLWLAAIDVAIIVILMLIITVVDLVQRRIRRTIELRTTPPSQD